MNMHNPSFTLSCPYICATDEFFFKLCVCGGGGEGSPYLYTRVD